MSQAFISHVGALEPGSADSAEFIAATASADMLLAYAQARGLDLSREDAERLTAATSSALDDTTLDGVSGGVDFGAVNAQADAALAELYARRSNLTKAEQ